MPYNLGQWQAAVDAAQGCLALAAARELGLITGGPSVNVQRCEGIIREGAALGVTPTEGAVADFMTQLLRALEA